MKRVFRVDAQGFFIEPLDIYPTLVSVETFPVLPGEVQEDGTIGPPIHSNEWVDEFVYQIPEDCVELPPPSQYRVQWLNGQWIQHELPPAPPPAETDYDRKLNAIVEEAGRIVENLGTVAENSNNLHKESMELNTATMMAVTEFYEQQQAHDAEAREESFNTMMAMTEIFEQQLMTEEIAAQFQVNAEETMATLQTAQTDIDTAIAHAHEHIHEIGGVAEVAKEKGEEGVQLGFDAMMGVANVFEQQLQSDEKCNQNGVMIMLGLAEAYEEQLETSKVHEEVISDTMEQVVSVSNALATVLQSLEKPSATELMIMSGLTEVYELVLGMQDKIDNLGAAES